MTPTLESVLCKLEPYSTNSSDHPELIGYDINGKRKGLFYDASVLLTLTTMASLRAAFKDMDYMHYVIAKKHGDFLDIDADGELYIADTFARLAFPELVFQRICTQCDVLQPTSSNFPTDSHGPLSRLRYCKTCDKKNKTAKASQRDESATKICVNCNDPWPETSYSVSDNVCSSCRSKMKRLAFQKRIVDVPGEKTCPACHLSQGLDVFAGKIQCAKCREETKLRMRAKRQANKM